MGAESFATSHAGKRSAKRARVLLAATLQTNRGDLEAKLRDLSQKGALVECKETLTIDSDVVFTRGNTVVPARVAWTSGNRIGLEFQHPIDENEVLIQLGRAPAPAGVTMPAPPPFRRPRLSTDMSERDRQLARLWGVQVGISVNLD